MEAAVTAVYRVPTLPSMSTYATDMWPLRARGVQCVGIGAGVDLEDQSIGYGMHSDQERLLESEFQRFVRLNWEIVTALAGARWQTGVSPPPFPLLFSDSLTKIRCRRRPYSRCRGGKG